MAKQAGGREVAGPVIATGAKYQRLLFHACQKARSMIGLFYNVSNSCRGLFLTPTLYLHNFHKFFFQIQGRRVRGFQAMFIYSLPPCNSSSIRLRRFNFVVSRLARAIQPR